VLSFFELYKEQRPGDYVCVCVYLMTYVLNCPNPSTQFPRLTGHVGVRDE
jgi:hypothetical protein